MTRVPSYDVVIVGGGPAGLLAARTFARLGHRTLVLERQPAPGRLTRPCHGMLVPVSPYALGEHRGDEIYYPELDLCLPTSLVTGYPVIERLVSPGGVSYDTPLTGSSERAPAIVVDKGQLLDYLADQASAAGAELQYGNGAVRLLRMNRQVTGVEALCGEVSAQLVVSAEGTGSQLCGEAGLPPHASPAQPCYAVTVSEELDAPRVGPGDLAHVLTLGRRYSSAPQAYGTVTTPAPGRAVVSFTTFSSVTRHHTDPMVWGYLDEYVHGDDRIRHLLQGARILQRSGSQRVLAGAPRHVVRDGFLAIGDAVAPGSHMGILPALYVARHAALLAAEALDQGDTSATALAPYDQFMQRGVLDDLAHDSRALWALTAMTDAEIDRLCRLLVRLHRTSPFFASWSALPWVAASWLASQVPHVEEDYGLLQRLLADESRTPAAQRPPVVADLPRSVPTRLAFAPY